MKFVALVIAQALLVKLDRHSDQRGFFARTFCADEFVAAGLPSRIAQSSMSYSARAGTVRGLHFQWPPSREAKLVRCVRGAIFDVLLDLRPESPSYLRHAAVRLDDEARDAVFVPPGVAHGFQTLVAETEVHYQMTDFYVPDLAAGVRWNDPSFGIVWPVPRASSISESDEGYPDVDRTAYESELARRAGAGK